MATFHATKIAILGTGLIGGSILRACVKRGLADKIAASIYDEDSGTRDLIAREGLTQVVVAGSAEEAVWDAGIVFLCVPAGRMAELVQRIAPRLDARAIVTDVGSVKGPLVHQLDTLLAGKALWVGGHPMAGREQAGFAMADADLFEGRKTILTPTGQTDPTALKLVTSFWKTLGAEVVHLTPETHDRLVANISHLPYLAASILAQSVLPESLAVAGPGFRDATRIAAAPAELWQEILLSNKAEVLFALDRLLADLSKARAALAGGDETELHALLKRANDMRRKLDAPSA